VYAQRVSESGVIDPRWPRDGLAVCTANGSQFFPRAVQDSAGGAIVAWYDHRGGASYDVYAQRVLGSGMVDSRWPENGRALCTARNDQRNPVLVPDGRGGALVAWEDARESARRSVYAQRVLGSGSIAPGWPADGLAVAPDPGARRPALAVDGRGGAFVAWEDDRSGDANLVARHLTMDGVLDPRWPARGRVLCSAPGEQTGLVAEADGAGGAVVVWEDFRNGAEADLYATRLTPAGTIDPAFGDDGRPLCAAPGQQLKPALARVAKGILAAVWEDGRAGAPTQVRAARLIVSAATSGTRRSASRRSAR